MIDSPHYQIRTRPPSDFGTGRSAFVGRLPGDARGAGQRDYARRRKGRRLMQAASRRRNRR